MSTMPKSAGVDLPLVSILIPTYNREGFLGEAIDSVLAQDYPALELLVLDDGSTDGTPAVVERYARSHPECLRSTRHENMGQPRTLNRGFELARGELIGYLSDDDVLLPGAVTKLADVLISEPDVVVAFSAFHVIDDGGEIQDTEAPAEFSLVESVRLHEPGIGPGALFRRSLLDRIGAWDPSLRYSPDWEFWLRAASVGKFRLVPEPLSGYRHHQRNTGFRGHDPRMAQERIEIIDRVYSGDVPEELLAVKDEAYRSAYISAAVLTGSGVNDPAERYYVVDRHFRRVSASSGAEDVEAQLGEERVNSRRLRELLLTRESELERLHDRLATVEAERAELLARRDRPWWLRAARRLTPRRLRPWVKRVTGRAKTT
jgi:glycosyltransferase involved in cell wall biosynthesis